jgi:hypothetical protein
MSLILSGTDGLSDIDGSAATPAIRGTDANTGIFFPAADTIAFAEGGAEIARFDSSGNMGIGSTPTAIGSYKVLEVNGTSGAYIALKQGGTEYGNIYNNSTDGTTISASGARNIIFQTNATERLRIPSNAGGITFPATRSASSDVNTLDDYEEGTWTPSVGGTATYGPQRNGWYIKVGNLVTIACDLSIGTIGTGSATTVSGLPFSNNAGGVTNGGGAISYFASLATTVYSLASQMSGATFVFVSTTSLSNSVVNVPSVIGSGTRFITTITYQTTD